MLNSGRSRGTCGRACCWGVALLTVPGVALAQDSSSAASATSTGAALPLAAALPAATPAPDAALGSPEPAQDAAAEEEASVSLPMGGWFEVSAGCRRLTDFQSSSEGCELGIRRGRYAYFHTGAGFFTTPRFERYVRYVDPDSSPADRSELEQATIIDPARPTIYYFELGPGVAIWPTRQINVHFEAGGMIGAAVSQASLVLPTADTSNFMLGFFGGVGMSYRVPSRPWTVGIDYRIQGVPYGGLSSGEEVLEQGVEVGHPLFGFAHSLGLSISLRIEGDRAD